jgi:septum formation protein
VLASASPRRRQLLESVGVRAEVVVTSVDEEPLAGESPSAMVCRLAEAKARAGLGLVGGAGVVVIGADTTVALGEESFGQPASDDEARAMLRRLSGRRHEVLTAVSVATVDACDTRLDRTAVVFRQLGEEEIADYVATGEPWGKAGGYAIQGRAGLFVSRIEGSHHTVIGLPVAVLDEMCLAVTGRPLRAWARRPGWEGSGGPTRPDGRSPEAGWV